MSAFDCFEEKEKQGRYSLVSNVDIQVLHVTANQTIIESRSNINRTESSNFTEITWLDYCSIWFGNLTAIVRLSSIKFDNQGFFKHFFTTVIWWQKLNFKLSFQIQFCEEK